jgi:hypothetical protein
MKKASWIVLFVVGLVILAVSLISTSVAFRGDWPIGPTTLTKLEAAEPGTGVPLRGARGTAAAFAAAYAVLFLTIVLGPYRRGETWAWWALLGSSLVLAGLVLLRIPLLGTFLGVPAAIYPLVLVLLGLVLDLGRVRG